MIQKIVTGPIDLVVKIGEKIKEEADRQLYDINHIQQQLMNLQMMHEMEEISERDYEDKEQELLERYEVAKRREQEQWEEMKNSK
ncbi:gas vesicle protein GvpG [Bacillus endophyticus]|jgi:hypothetical protein|uniref:gas vesicle protein GvpG n=1 Tax=Priestia endophytica TaxID=135735 RepID=UPI0018CCA6A0|nr:gas vesicle protein GvpG [Priestia endophytica]MBG9811042.1 gas vesicle protein GvpG [Priestia endophytica]MBG9813559.1 gas vesicle protein GvpG [Priestia endophytica]